MPVGFNLNVTYGLKPQVSSIKNVIVYRRSIFQLRVTIPQGQHHVSSSQQSYALIGGVRTWMSDQLRIPRVVITSFFSFPFEGDIKDYRTPQPCVMSVFLFLSYLFLISPCPPFACIFTISYNHTNIKTARPVVVALQFWHLLAAMVLDNLCGPVASFV